MKNIIIICALFLIGNTVSAQEIDTNYYPQKTNAISEASYTRGNHILKNSYSQIIEGKRRPNYADYWNVAVGLAYMGEQSNVVRQFLLKARSMNNDAFCIIINYQLSSENGSYEEIRLYNLFGQEYINWVNGCEGIENSTKTLEERFAEKNQLDLTGLNEALIDRLIVLIEKDQRYRYSSKKYDENVAKQTVLDRENEKEIVSIFEEFGYPGKLLVGEKYMDYGCLILEHIGQSPNQDKYLPLVIDAYKKGDVHKSVVTMLIDRIYWKNTGKQIFGSHIGIPFADDATIANLKSKYDL